MNATRNYVIHSVWALIGHGLVVDRSWLDPRDPRDATIVLQDTRALLWDEVTGWRLGLFRSGRPGLRTELDDVTYLGGGPLPTPRELARRVIAGATAPRHEYRSHTDVRDGLDDALAAH